MIFQNGDVVRAIRDTVIRNLTTNATFTLPRDAEGTVILDHSQADLYEVPDDDVVVIKRLMTFAHLPSIYLPV